MGTRGELQGEAVVTGDAHELPVYGTGNRDGHSGSAGCKMLLDGETKVGSVVTYGEMQGGGVIGGA